MGTRHWEKKRKMLRLLVQKPIQRVATRPLSITASLSGYEHKHQALDSHMNPGYMGFGGKVLGKTKHAPKLRRSWYCVRLTSQAGTGSMMHWVRHEKDPKVVLIHEDKNLPDKYVGEEREVVWIETERLHRVFPGSRKMEKRRIANDSLQHGYDPYPEEGQTWHRQLPGSRVRKLQSQVPKFKMTENEIDKRRDGKLADYRKGVSALSPAQRLQKSKSNWWQD